MHQLLLRNERFHKTDLSDCDHTLITSAPPVECVEHFYGYKDREGHGHWVEVIEYFAVLNVSKIRIIRGALQVVGL